MMSVSLADLFFPSRHLAHVARCSRLWSGSFVPDLSLSVQLSIPHTCGKSSELDLPMISFIVWPTREHWGHLCMLKADRLI
jgi:hypothetical protein